MQARVFCKLLFKILLAESYPLHMSRVVRWPIFTGLAGILVLIWQRPVF